MAFVDPNQITPAVNQPSQAPVAAGGQGIGGATKKAESTPGVNTPQQPSAQLSAYLSANQPQTTAYAGNIANTLSGQTSAAANAINPAVNTYTGQLYTVPTDQTVNQAVATAPSGLTQQQTSTYQTELNAANNAPNSANTFEAGQPYQDLASNIQNVVGQANLWNSGNNVANISTALAPFEGANATTGGKTLDSLLLSQTPGAYSQITNAVAPAANLQNQLQAGTNQADTALQGAIAQDQAATAAATAAPQTYATNLSNYLNNAVTSGNQAGTTQNSQILADLQAGTPSQADLTALGITPAQWSTLSSEMSQAAAQKAPITLSDYLSQTAPNITAAGLATPTQYADVAALQNLLGGNAPVEPINAVTANQAGTAPTSFNNFNLAGAETGAQANTLLSQAKQIEAQGQTALAGYQQNHFGGMSPDQFNNYIQGLNDQLNAIKTKMNALNASQNINNVTGVGQNPSNPSELSGEMNRLDSGNIGSDALNAFADVGSLGTLPLLRSLGHLFGLAEGGEVPRRDELPNIAAVRG